MSRTTWILSAFGVVSSIVSFYLWHSLREANDQLAQLQAIEQSKVTRQDLPVVEMTPSAQTDGNDAENLIQPELPPPTSMLVEKQRELRRELMQDPKYNEAQRTQIRLTLMRRDPRLAEDLGLSTEQIRELYDVLVDAEISIRNAPANDGESLSQASERERVAAAREEADRKLVALLGVEKFKQWQDYRESYGSRQRVEQLRTMLSSTGQQQLTSEQARFLAGAMHSESARRQEQFEQFQAITPNQDSQLYRERFMDEQARFMDDSDRRLLSIASSTLSSDQLAALTQLLDGRRQGEILGRSEQQLLHKAAEESAKLPPGALAEMFSTLKK